MPVIEHKGFNWKQQLFPDMKNINVLADIYTPYINYVTMKGSLKHTMKSWTPIQANMKSIRLVMINTNVTFFNEYIIHWKTAWKKTQLIKIVTLCPKSVKKKWEVYYVTKKTADNTCSLWTSFLEP